MATHEIASEEFNNFMHRVNEVTGIIKKLASDDKDLQEIGTIEADRFLKEDDTIDCENVRTFVTQNKTVINRKALLKDDSDPETMSREAFMDEVARDADRRHRDRQVRTEKMQTFRKRATQAFRRGEFEKALVCYDRSVELIRDSCPLYLDRCLTLLRLELYERAAEDAETALKLNEDSLKGWLLLAKAQKKMGNEERCEEAVREARRRNPEHEDLIEEYVKALEGSE